MEINNHSIHLIGISGKKRHGKDTFARLVTNELGGANVQTRPFAAALKAECADFVAQQVYNFSGALVYDHEILNAMNSDIPEKKEPYRLLLQWWGTEFRRNMCASDYWLVQHRRWIAEFANRLGDDWPIVVLVPDVRFPDEKAYLQSHGGVVVRLSRGGMADTDTHPSETALDDCRTFDYWVNNDGSLADLAAKAASFCQWLKVQWKRPADAAGATR